GGRLENASIVAKLEALGDLMYRATIGGGGPPKGFIEGCARRPPQVTIFFPLIQGTPHPAPYLDGGTYKPLLSKLIPRAVYPEKPQEVSGQAFGHRYGLIANGNFSTTVNLPQLVEGYANFGPFGVIAAMFLIGLLYRGTLAMFVHPGMGLGAL